MPVLRTIAVGRATGAGADADADADADGGHGLVGMRERAELIAHALEVQRSKQQVFKELADKKHEIFDEDLQALVSDTLTEETPEHFKLVSLEVSSRTGEIPEARLVLSVDGAEQDARAQGSGPVDAIFKAIEGIASSAASLQLYSVNAITEGTDSQGEVTVRLEKAGRIVNGNGADTDILVASAKAYVNALNLMQATGRAHPQVDGV